MAWRRRPPPIGDVAEVPDVDGAPTAVRWGVDVDPAFGEALGTGKPLLELGMYFKPVTFRLANNGPALARDIELLPLDENQQFEGRHAWPLLEAGQWVRFAVNRQFFSDNGVRLQWLQDGGPGRYWTTVWLPSH